MHDLAAKFYNLFRGLDRAHGIYNITHSENGKQKGHAATVHNPVTLNLWQGHLEGKQRIGIVPINDNNVCNWGVIDIDKKEHPNIQHGEIEKKIAAFGMPLVVCRSKSGDAHLFLFLKEPIAAGIVRKTLTCWAAELGFSKAEIFPKQDTLAGANDAGNWLNMPYFNAAQTLCYGFKNGEAILSPDDFIDYCESKKIDSAFLGNFIIKFSDPEFEDAPPCIQHYIKHGFTSYMNNALFSMGVFARMKFGDSWESKVDEYNIRFMKPGSSKEVQNIIKELKKKSYYYKCKDEPLRSQCNKVICRVRKYGVGPGSDSDDIGVVIDGLQKLLTRPPIWFVNVLGTNGNKYRIELSNTDDLMNQRGFNKQCVETLNFFPPKIDGTAWRNLVQKALDKVEEIAAPAEASQEGALMDCLQTFLTARACGKFKDDLKTNRPWFNEDDNFYYFKAEAFFVFIKQQAANWFSGWTRSKFYSKLKDNGLTADQLHGVGRVWKIHIDKLEKIVVKDLPLPKIESNDDVPF